VAHPALYAYLICAYLIGSVPVGVILAKLKGRDPRQAGSGNIGATNVMRTAGKTLGILTLLGDALKGFVPTALAISYGESAAFAGAVGLAAFLGHLFPIFLKFKGGKGVATELGVYAAISPLALAIAFLVFVTVLLKWRFVSLGSLVATGTAPLILYLIHAPYEYVCLAFIVGAMVFLRHRDNMVRIRTGTEHRIWG
jgi:acyl phosphate:glycerol-3-phosphate acyltransferase